MLIRAYALFILSFSSIMSLAIPLAGPHCKETSYERGFRDLIHKVGVVGVDDRRRTSELVERGDISREEEDLLKAATGSIHCPAEYQGRKGEIRGSAVAVNPFKEEHSGSSLTAGDHGPSSVLLTAAHLFYYPDSDIPLPDISKCYFLNRAGKRIGLDLERVNLVDGNLDPRRIRLGTMKPNSERTRDRAVVRLKSVNSKSLGIDSSGEFLRKNQRFINISVPHRDMKNYNFRKDLVGQVCSARKVEFFPQEGPTPAVMTDCSAAGQASGSVLLVRNRENQLTAVAVLVGGASPPDPSRIAFDEIDNHSNAVGIDRVYADEISAIFRGLRMSTAAVSN